MAALRCQLGKASPFSTNALEVLCLVEALQGNFYNNAMLTGTWACSHILFALNSLHLAGWLSLDFLSFYFEDNCSTRGVGRPWVETLYVADLFFFLRQAQLSEADASA